MHLPTLYNHIVAPGLRITAVKLLKYNLHTVSVWILSVQGSMFYLCVVKEQNPTKSIGRLRDLLSDL